MGDGNKNVLRTCVIALCAILFVVIVACVYLYAETDFEFLDTYSSGGSGNIGAVTGGAKTETPNKAENPPKVEEAPAIEEAPVTEEAPKTESKPKGYMYSLDYMGTWYGFGTDGNEAQFKYVISEKDYNTATVKSSGWGTNSRAGSFSDVLVFVSANKAEIAYESGKSVFTFSTDSKGRQSIVIDHLDYNGKHTAESAEVYREPVLENETTSQTSQPAQKPATSAKTSRKSEFQQRYDTLNNKEIPDGPQQQMNVESGKLFDEWDVLLNDIYKYLKEIKPSSEFKAIEKDEIQWIKRKEEAIESAANEFYGGSMAPLVANTTAIKYTKERCQYLISLI